MQPGPDLTLPDPGPPSDGDDLARATSDELMRVVERLTGHELEKRSVPTDSPEFVRLAEVVEQEAQLIERWARLQLAVAHQTAERVRQGLMSGAPVRDITPRPLARILAEWREAQFRLDGAQPGSAEADRATADVRRLRAEYGTSFATRRERPAPLDPHT